MQALDPSGRYSDAAVLRELQAVDGSRVFSYRFDRLSSTNGYLGALTAIEKASVALNSLADIKRTAKFTILDSEVINYLKDRIQPFARLTMPDGGFVEWPLGVFLLSTPARKMVGGIYASRDVEAYDQLAVLQDDKTADRLSYPVGTAYTAALQAIATAHAFTANITASTLVMPTAMEWDPGTSYLRVVNDILAAINYESASFDEVGTFIAKPYVSPAIRASGYTYASDAFSLISGDVTQTLDLFSVPNKWVLVVSDPDRPPIVGTYVNTSPSSPTSTIARGRTIVDYRSEQDAADQVTLDAKAARLAVEASQVFETLTFSTAVMPIHSTSDVLTVRLSELVVDSKYSEQSWSYDLEPGSLMTHSVRRVVTV